MLPRWLLFLCILIHGGIEITAFSNILSKTQVSLIESGGSNAGPRQLIIGSSPRVEVLLSAKKGKRPKVRRSNDDNQGDDEGEDEQESSAPRVSSNIPHVRRQIAVVRQMKKLMKQEYQRASEPGRKARRKKENSQRKGMESDYPSFDPSAAQTVLLVDGYNLINKWSKTIKARSRGGMPYARQELLEQLRYIYHARRWKVVVAYDENAPGAEFRIMEGDIDEVFTGNEESADSYIEKRAQELAKQRAGPKVIVATDDRTIQIVSASPAAELMSTSRLIKEIYVARKELLFRRTGDDFRHNKPYDDSLDYFIE